MSKRSLGNKAHNDLNRESGGFAMGRNISSNLSGRRFEDAHKLDEHKLHKEVSFASEFQSSSYLLKFR